MADLHFELVTPDRLVMSDDVYMVVVPGTEGESGIMAGHAPYMTTLRNGDIAVYRYLPGHDNLDEEATRSAQFVRAELKKG